jgi:hypothetical protein
VRQQVRPVRADAREAQGFRDRGDHGYRTIGGHGERAVDPDPTRDLENAFEVREIDDLGDVCLGEAGSIPVAVDRSDAEASRTRLLDRTPLVAPCAHEQNRRHAGDARRSLAR